MDYKLINRFRNKWLKHINTHKYNKLIYRFRNKWLKHLDTQLNKPTNQNSGKVPKVVKPTNKKMLL